jgi:hypothetical protein
MKARALILAPLFLAACSPFGRAGVHRVLLALPRVPPAWSCLTDLRFEVEWLGASGLRETASAAPDSCVAVELPRGIAQAIRARAFTRGLALASAGALYPECMDADSGCFPLPWASGGPLVLDWRGGYAAEVAAALESAGVDPLRFDLARLRRELDARVVDPWSALAPLELARRLASGAFRIDALREPERRAVELPGPGPWAPESPLASPPEPLLVKEDGTAGSWSAYLPAGIHRFIGPSELLTARIGMDGETICVGLPRAAPGEMGNGKVEPPPSPSPKPLVMIESRGCSASFPRDREREACP